VLSFAALRKIHTLVRRNFMTRRFILVILIALMLGAMIVGSALAQTPTTKQVGLVIAFPDGTQHTEIVTVPAVATALDALQAAKITLASTDGGFGPAVCGINNVGCSITNCFCDAAHFWAYYHLNPATSQWGAATEGVGTYVPANGSVEGFAWSGFDESYNPTIQPPVYTFDQIVAAPEPATLPKTGANPVTLVLSGLGGLLLVIGGLGAGIRQGKRN
jgi:LPXTG-motif cell wall-anchored protein